jgi:hypothetical protein
MGKRFRYLAIVVGSLLALMLAGGASWDWHLPF